MKSLISSLVLLPLVASCAVPSKSELDAEVDRLCAIDGGIKVYEAVKLLPDQFNEYGQINFYHPAQGENALGKNYIFKQEITYLRQGNPEMWRTQILIVRRSDQKTLGKTVGYSRRGGDTPGPQHDSSYGCPDERGDVPLLVKVFVK